MMSRKERHKRASTTRKRRQALFLFIVTGCAIGVLILVWSGYGAHVVDWVLGTDGDGTALHHSGTDATQTKGSDSSPDRTTVNDLAKDNNQVEQWLKTLTLDEKIGQMFLVHLSALTAEKPNQVLPDILHELAPGGVILFKDDIKTVGQTIEDNVQMLRSSRIPLWIGVDQEGGLVNRILFAGDWNGNMAIAATGQPQLAKETAFETGSLMQLLSFNLNFAPVADVNDDPYNPVIGLRSFGSEPKQVSSYVRAYIQGAHKSGIPAIVKHFPGHGSTRTDSHVGLPQLTYDLMRFEQVEWLPFKAAIEEGVDMIMSAHIQVPQLEPKTTSSQKDGSLITIPATLSSRVLTDILRDQLNFQGVIITDALNMKAIADHFGSDEAAVLSIQAGADVLLMPPKPHQAIAAIHKAIEKGTLTEQRIDESVRRILQLKLKYKVTNAKQATQLNVEQAIGRALSFIASNQAQGLMKRIAEQAVTPWGTDSIAEQPNVLITSSMNQVLLVGHDSVSLEAMQRALVAEVKERRDTVTKEKEAHEAANSNKERLVETEVRVSKLEDTGLTDTIRAADAIVIVTNDVYRQPRRIKLLEKLIAQIEQIKKPVAVVAAGLPYDAQALANIPIGYAIYGLTDSNVQAAARVLLGRAAALGHFPVAVAGLP